MLKFNTGERRAERHKTNLYFACDRFVEFPIAADLP